MTIRHHLARGLVVGAAIGRHQLFNLSRDFGEQHDVSDSEVEVARRLAAQTQVWMNKVGI